MTLSLTEGQQLPPAPNAADCSVDPTYHILAIDKPGDYRPNIFPCGNGKVLHQVRPDHLVEDGCKPIGFSNPKIDSRQIDDYAALQCQIDRIIDALAKPQDGQPQHLVIFIHGGLVGQQASLDRAGADIPQMVTDKDALQDIPENPQGSGPSDVLMRGSKIFPLFLSVLIGTNQKSSWPDLIRPSTYFRRTLAAPAITWIRGSSPRMTTLSCTRLLAL